MMPLIYFITTEYYDGTAEDTYDDSHGDTELGDNDEVDTELAGEAHMN